MKTTSCSKYLAFAGSIAVVSIAPLAQADPKDQAVYRGTVTTDYAFPGFLDAATINSGTRAWNLGASAGTAATLNGVSLVPLDGMPGNPESNNGLTVIAPGPVASATTPAELNWQTNAAFGPPVTETDQRNLITDSAFMATGLRLGAQLPGTTGDNALDDYRYLGRCGDLSNYDNFAIDISAVQGQLYHIEILATPFVLTHWKNFNVVVDHTMVARNLYIPGRGSTSDGVFWNVTYEFDVVADSDGIDIEFSRGCTSDAPVPTGRPRDVGNFSVSYEQASQPLINAISVTPIVDIDAPQASVTIEPVANAAGWRNSDVTIDWNWTDPPGSNGAPASGLDPDNCELTAGLSGEGEFARVGQCSDLAGNLGLKGTGIVRIDKTPPETGITASPVSGVDNSATFEFAGSDATSGISSFTCTIGNGQIALGSPCSSPHQISGIQPGTYTFTVSAIDLAGNVDATPASHSWSIVAPESTPPMSTPTFEPMANAAGWHNSDVTINWNWSDEPSANGDPASGINPDACTFASILAEEGAALSVDAQCTDLAGNTGGQSVAPINIDKTAPDTAIQSSESTSDTARISFIGSDAGSGIAGFECQMGSESQTEPYTACTSPATYMDLANGDYQFNVRAIDAADNTDSSAASYGFHVDVPRCDPAVLSRFVSPGVWHLLHLPCQTPQTFTMGDLFSDSALTDEQWAAFYYDALTANPQYRRILRHEPIPEQGFWFTSSQPVTLKLPANSKAQEPATASFCAGTPCYNQTIDASSAWNLLGNPADVNLRYGQAWLTNASTDCQENAPCLLDIAASEHGITAAVFVYSQNIGYRRLGPALPLQQVVLPWSGYWVRMSGDATDPWQLYLPRYESQLMFVTGEKFSGDLGGVAGAHAKCQQAAVNSGLPGNYHAWLSDSALAPAAGGSTMHDRPYIRLDGEVVGSNWNALVGAVPVAGIDAAVSITPNYAEMTSDSDAGVWTNTLADGTVAAADGHCSDWRSADASLSSSRGLATRNDISWTSGGDNVQCDSEQRLYCIGGQ